MSRDRFRLAQTQPIDIMDHMNDKEVTPHSFRKELFFLAKSSDNQLLKDCAIMICELERSAGALLFFARHYREELSEKPKYEYFYELDRAIRNAEEFLGEEWRR